ncbi:hypothetical protein Tco_0147679, partial [Tanacetum coccineum]
PSCRLLAPAVLIPGCPALPCKVSSLVAVETLHFGLVRNLQESSCPHSQHSKVPPQAHLF